MEDAKPVGFEKPMKVYAVVEFFGTVSIKLTAYKYKGTAERMQKNRLAQLQHHIIMRQLALAGITLPTVEMREIEVDTQKPIKQNRLHLK